MNNNISFAVTGIELLDYAITSPHKAIANGTSYKFDLNIEHRFNIEQKRVFVVVAVRVHADGIESELASANVSCIYNIHNLENFVEEKKVKFPDDFIVTLNSISLSTVRGVLFTLFRGTFLHNVILPILDPKEFISENHQPQPGLVYKK
jgi:hypothetical protein